MVDVDELLDGVPVRLAPAPAVRARGERRRTRQGVGVAAAVLVVAGAVGAVGVSSWPHRAPAPPGTSVASHGDAAEGENPFKPHGVVQNLKPSDLPKDAALHWKIDYPGDDSDDVALPQAGLNGACDGWSGRVTAPKQLFTSTFTGSGDARARYRVAQYANAGQAGDAIRALGQTLQDCGLTEQSGSYSGRANGNGLRLDVSVRQWGAWVGVTEAQYNPTA